MGKATKIWLVMAAVLVVAGCILFGSVMMMLRWDFSKLDTNKMVTNTYEVRGEFRRLSIEVDTAHIRFAVSENGNCRVESYGPQQVSYAVSVEDDILSIKTVDQRKWYDHLHFHFSAPELTVYLPKGSYDTLSLDGSAGNVEIPEDFQFENMLITVSTGRVSVMASVSDTMRVKTSTGDICVENVTADRLELSVSTGAIRLTNVSCQNLISKASTGDIVLRNVIAGERFTIKTTTGNVKFDRCDAHEISVSTDTGSVTGSFLTDKVFAAKSSTGKVDVPKTTTGGTCEIKTNTGNIKLTIG